MTRLIIAGLGYTGRATAVAALRSGWSVTIMTRNPGQAAIPGATLVAFDEAATTLADATHLLLTAPPRGDGDPVLRRYRNGALGTSRRLQWIGYLSTTGVYGDRGGAEVDESAAPNPGSERTRNRVIAENAWCRFADHGAVDLIRLAGIYGPGRSVIDAIVSGSASRIEKPGHKFNRIHVEDIARGVLAAVRTAATPGVRVLHFADDEPASSADVVGYAAALLGREPPPLVPFREAALTMSPMALSFWSESRIIRNSATKARLGLAWRYPTYREGLQAIFEGSRAPSMESGSGTSWK